MRVKITPGTLSGHIDAVASKSHAHRLLIAAALCDEKPEVNISTTSADIEATKACLAQLDQDVPVMDCGESGSTLRFMVPVAMALKEEAIFLGRGKLPYRPLNHLVTEMARNGCQFDMNMAKGEALQKICHIRGKLQPGDYYLPGDVTSQYITGLLFALSLVNGNSMIHLTSPLESGKYVDMTLDVMNNFGVRVEKSEKDGLPLYHINGKQKYCPPERIEAEGDWSNIAFWIIAGILNEDGFLHCHNLPQFTQQGDKAIIDLAKEMGGFITYRNESCLLSRHELNAINIDASEIPDLVPILAVAAATANGTTHIYNAGRLRIKESDRLSAVCDNLANLGADITEEPEGIIIRGVPQLNGGIVYGHNDHRIVMAMAIASLVCKTPVIIEGAEAVNKSYPTFFDDFKSLGGEIRVI